MESTYGAMRDFGALTEKEYAALMIRLVLGTLYLCHPFLMWAIFGLEHAAHYFASLALPPATAYAMAAAELLGGAMLLLGLYTRQVAIALLPIAIGAAVVHFGTDLGAGLSYGAYLACCLAGQALLASGVFAPQPDAGHPDWQPDLPPSGHAGH
jgi:putative oxidoreductase